MKTLYESILDNEETLINQSDKKFGDLCSVECIEMFTGSFDDADPDVFFKLNDIDKYCKRNKLKVERYWSVDSDHTNVLGSQDEMDCLHAAIIGVPYIGFEQNIEGLLREFLKPGFKIHLVSSKKDLNVFAKAQYEYDGDIEYRVEPSSKKGVDSLLIRIWYNKNQ